MVVTNVVDMSQRQRRQRSVSHDVKRKKEWIREVQKFQSPLKLGDFPFQGLSGSMPRPNAKTIPYQWAIRRLGSGDFERSNCFSFHLFFFRRPRRICPFLFFLVSGLKYFWCLFDLFLSSVLCLTTSTFKQWRRCSLSKPQTLYCIIFWTPPDFLPNIGL